MRYAKERKQETRRRIVETAGRRFKRDGIDGSGVATLMKDAGLTNGAFYAHFDSKDDLVAAAISDQLTRQAEAFTASAEIGGFEQFVRNYLSPRHRDEVGDGCPSAALLDEIGRSSPIIKEAYTDGLMVVVDAIAARLTDEDPQSARVRVLTAFALMAGTIQLSRALSGPVLADQILDRGVRDALALFDEFE